VWPANDAGAGGRFLAPRDDTAGGSWLGLTRTGMFVGITNRHPPLLRADRVSRGVLVIDALKFATARDAAAHLRGIAGDRHNGFHLVTADAHDAFITWSDGQTAHQTRLEPGLHVVTERSLGAADDRARADKVRALWPDDDDPAALMRMLAAGQDADPFANVCVDVPSLDYGTRSSLVYLGAANDRDARMWWSEGQPRAGSFVEHPEWLRALTQSAA
jgi:uncharacterized protein with NRDE domain